MKTPDWSQTQRCILDFIFENFSDIAETVVLTGSVKQMFW